MSNQQFEENRENSDHTNIMELLKIISCVSNSLELQGYINMYLKKLLHVPHVFMVPIVDSSLPESNEGLIQVVNDRVLEKEIRFSVSH